MSTKIQWTNETWNTVSGCTRVSSGCDLCYAVTMSHRLEGMGQERYAGLTVLNNRGDRHFNGTVRTHPETLEIPLHWRKPRMIFVNSMGDTFHDKVPFEFIDRMFAVMYRSHQHTYQILTKRPERMAEYFDSRTACMGEHIREQVWKLAELGVETGDPNAVMWPPPNVWLGTSCEDQATADARIPHLLRCPAAVRFLSLEPMLGPIDLRFGQSEGLPTNAEPFRERGDLISWVIVGGESGPVKKVRPFDLDWARSVRDQCRSAGVAFFFKQAGRRPVENGVPLRLKDSHGGKLEELPEDLRVREFPEADLPQSAGFHHKPVKGSVRVPEGTSGKVMSEIVKRVVTRAPKETK